MVQDGRVLKLTAQDLRRLLEEIGAEFARQGKVAEIAIYGGSALLLMFDNRPATRDIDFITVDGAREEIIATAGRIGSRHGLTDGWFNDSVIMHMSDSPDYRFIGDFPDDSPGLRVFSASPHYIMAMKLLALRSSLESSDFLDIWNLMDICGIEDVEGAEKLLSGFFPDKEMPPHRVGVLEDLFAEKLAGRPYDPMIGW